MSILAEGDNHIFLRKQTLYLLSYNGLKKTKPRVEHIRTKNDKKKKKRKKGAEETRIGPSILLHDALLHFYCLLLPFIPLCLKNEKEKKIYTV